jgi:hypothetical protein
MIVGLHENSAGGVGRLQPKGRKMNRIGMAMGPAIIVALGLCVLVAGHPAHARSLSSLLAPNPVPGSTVVAAPFVAQLQETIARSTDFRATATTPGFTYSFNPQLNLYERSTTSLGPAFLERADTIGAGRFDIGMTYLWASFQQLNGQNLNGLTEGILFKDAGVLDSAVMRFNKFNLSTNNLYFSGTYGVAENWDVNVLLPVYITSLSVRQTIFTTSFGNPEQAGSDTVLGPGDLQLRTKYMAWSSGELKLAPGFALRIPTGNEQNFQGIGDYTVTPWAVLSWAHEKLDVHGSLGVEVDASDLAQTRVAYGTGVSWGALDKLTLNFDVLGTSQFVSDTTTQVLPTVPIGEVQQGAAVFGPDVQLVSINGGNGSKIVTTLARQDLVDVALGFKFNVYGSAVVYANVIVPLTNDGARAWAIPAGGIEVSF